MNITKVRVTPEPPENGNRVLAYCSITIDDALVVHDIRIVAAATGRAIVAMPDRKLADRCPWCSCRNHLLARYCNHCGHRLDAGRAPRSIAGKSLIHTCIAHPLDSETRSQIETAIFAAYRDETTRLATPTQDARRDLPTPA